MRSRIAILATLSLLAGAQALAPAPAAAQDDQPGCLRVTTWPFVEFTKDCPKGDGAGTGEQIVIVDAKPDPDRPPSRPGHEASIGGDLGRPAPGTGGGGRRSPSMGVPAMSPGALKKAFERCEKVREDLETLRRKQRKAGPDGEIGEMVWIAKPDVARGTVGYWKWVTLTPDQAGRRDRQLSREWRNEGCAKIAPVDVY